MTRRLIIPVLIFTAALWFTDRAIAGWVQCSAAKECPK